ncbi:MAG: YeeE/YedE family protein [Myxococcota bacterium]
MENFTPVPALVGGLLIGLSSSLILVAHGKVTGISGFVGGLLQKCTTDRAFRAFFLGGLLVAGAGAVVLAPHALGQPVASLPMTAAAGLLVGFGTRLGNGCTSGHGVCGISRQSTRSVLATITFMVTGGITVFVVRHLVGGF